MLRLDDTRLRVTRVASIVPVVVRLVVVGLEEKRPVRTHDAVDITLEGAPAEIVVGLAGRRVSPHLDALFFELRGSGEIGPHPDPSRELAVFLKLQVALHLVIAGDVLDFDDSGLRETREGGSILVHQPFVGFRFDLFSDLFESRGAFCDETGGFSVGHLHARKAGVFESRCLKSRCVGQEELIVEAGKQTGIVRGDLVDHRSARFPSPLGPILGGGGPQRPLLVGAPETSRNPLTVLEGSCHPLHFFAKAVVIRHAHQIDVDDELSGSIEMRVAVDETGEDELPSQIDDASVRPNVGVGLGIFLENSGNLVTVDDHGGRPGLRFFHGVDDGVSQHDVSRRLGGASVKRQDRG